MIALYIAGLILSFSLGFLTCGALAMCSMEMPSPTGATDNDSQTVNKETLAAITAVKKGDVKVFQNKAEFFDDLGI